MSTEITKVDLAAHRVQVGKQFKMIREAQGWTCEQVATMADVKEVTIEKIEAGAFNVPLDLLARVADVLGCEVLIRQAV